NMRQLKQRVALRCEISPFELPETAAYIASRVTMAGGVPSQLFTQEAVRLVHEHSGGIARIISVICDNALVTGMALGRKPVDRAIVQEVCQSFSLNGSGGRVSVVSMPVPPIGNGRRAASEVAEPSPALVDEGEDQRESLEQRSHAKKFKLFGVRVQ
ncbi:MAG: hypothetical protein ACRD15_19490, partial [Vicinamibacterales bacterium]